MMQLDDYEIKPNEIEIMTNLDGSPATLGRGAFGEVKVSRFLAIMLSHAFDDHANTRRIGN